MSKREQNGQESLKFFYQIDGIVLEAKVHTPAQPIGLIILADGIHPGVQYSLGKLATCFEDHGYGTVTTDLHTFAEAKQGAGFRMTMPLARKRLSVLLQEIQSRPRLERLHKGLCCIGASAAASVSIATRESGVVNALALFEPQIEGLEADLPWLETPSLFLVSKANVKLRERVRSACEIAGQCSTKTLELLPGELMSVGARETLAWFDTFLPARRRRVSK